MFESHYSNHLKAIIKSNSITQSEKVSITSFGIKFQTYGLSNWSYYEGKIRRSTDTLDENTEEYKHAKKYCLWHYHIGYPHYIQKDSYKISDYVLHFIWDDVNQKNKIKLVDYTPHKLNGIFPLPEYNKLV